MCRHFLFFGSGALERFGRVEANQIKHIKTNTPEPKNKKPKLCSTSHNNIISINSDSQPLRPRTDFSSKKLHKKHIPLFNFLYSDGISLAHLLQ